MRLLFNSREILWRSIALLAAALLICALLATAAAARPDEPANDAVGVIDGEAITVSGPMSVEVVHGQTKTLLRSGSDIRVKSGTASIDLIEGGQITICGPAHLSVLKSGGSLTVALDSGTIHVHIEREPALTIYTAQIQAQPVAVGDGPQDALVGFDTKGSMCIRANRGAMRLEQQLSGQSILVPQNGDVLLTNGQLDELRSSSGHCSCELQVAKLDPPPPEVSRVATPEEISKTSETKPSSPEPGDDPPAPKEEPVYQVFMPPLVYDAKNKVQPEIDPKMIVLVRRVRVRSSLIFRGRVESVAVASATAPQAPLPAASVAKPKASANDSFVDRVRNFVHKLWSRSS